MNKNLKTGLSVGVSLLLAAYLVYWVSGKISWEESRKELESANYLYVLISFLFGAVAYWLRSQRWRLLLDPLGYRISAMTAWSAVSVNYMMNLLIPRSGELARCAAIYKSEDVPVDESVGTVVVERVIDFICLFIVIGLSMLTNFSLISELVQKALDTRQNTESEPSYTAFIFLGILLVLGSVSFLFRKQITATPFFKKVIEFVRGLKRGFGAVFQLKNRGLFLLYTLLIWLFYYLMTYLIVFAFEGSAHLSPAAGLFLLVAGGVGMVIPASGGIGSYHAAMGLAFVTLGLSGELGTAFALIIHTPHTLLALLFGFIGFVYLSKKNKTL